MEDVHVDMTTVHFDIEICVPCYYRNCNLWHCRLTCCHGKFTCQVNITSAHFVMTATLLPVVSQDTVTVHAVVATVHTSKAHALAVMHMLSWFTLLHLPVVFLHFF